MPHKGCSEASDICKEKTCKSMLLEGLIPCDPSERFCVTFPVTAEHGDCTKGKIFQRTNPSEVEILYRLQ